MPATSPIIRASIDEVIWNAVTNLNSSNANKNQFTTIIGICLFICYPIGPGWYSILRLISFNRSSVGISAIGGSGGYPGS